MLILFKSLMLAWSVAAAPGPAPATCGADLHSNTRFVPLEDPWSGRWQRTGRRLRVYWDEREEGGVRRVLVYWDAESRLSMVHRFLSEVAPADAEAQITYTLPSERLDLGSRAIVGATWRALAWTQLRTWWNTRERVALARYEVSPDLIVWVRPGRVEDAIGVSVPVETVFDDSFGRALARLVSASTTPSVSLGEASTHVGALREVLAQDMAEYVAARGLRP